MSYKAVGVELENGRVRPPLSEAVLQAKCESCRGHLEFHRQIIGIATQLGEPLPRGNPFGNDTREMSHHRRFAVIADIRSPFSKLWQFSRVPWVSNRPRVGLWVDWSPF